jgi:cyclophilin family peptidyl-prolyl cis-trans isomerase
MSQNVPPQIQGQIEAPNPLELFWEKNKRVVTFGAIAAVVALAINYLVQYQVRRSTSEKWSTLAAASGLDRAYTDVSEQWAGLQAQIQRFDEMVANNPQFAQFAMQQRQSLFQNFYVQIASRQVATLDEDLKDADVATLEAIVATKDDRAPLALWTLANRAYFEQDFAAAKARIEKLRSEFPKHFLCVESPYPVQWRDEVPKPDEPKEDEANPKKDEKPELVPPRPGSAAGLLLAQVEAEQKFRAENPRFFEAKQPTSAETVVFEIENAGTIKIKLFSEQVPNHAAKFLELARAGFWVGMRIHEIRREPQPNVSGSEVPNELAFGWKSTKDEDDRTKWLPGDVDEANTLGWERAELSHFPGTVAVEVAKAGKSQVERIVINGDDAAEQADGARVIVGRIVEGMDVLEDIVNGGFADATSVTTGRGKPEENYVIKSVTVE